MKDFFKYSVLLGICLFFLISCAKSDYYTIKEFGSFHIGGRQVTLSNLPVRELVLTKGDELVKSPETGHCEERSDEAIS